jgi:hypothetical protein
MLLSKYTLLAPVALWFFLPLAAKADSNLLQIRKQKKEVAEHKKRSECLYGLGFGTGVH